MLTPEATEAWGEWVGRQRDWNLFGGLTFDQRKFPQERILGVDVPRVVSRDVAAGRFRRWVRVGEHALHRRMDYVAALQYQRNGWPHFHPLLDVGELAEGDIAVLGKLWFQENGYGRLEVPRDGVAVCEYACRYLVRDIDSGDVLFSKGLGAFVPWQTPFRRR